DEATTARVDEKCYKVPPHETNPFDKGHNAPNGAIDGRYGLDAQRDTFLMSNVCPQAACLNEGAWQGFEKIESEDYGRASSGRGRSRGRSSIQPPTPSTVVFRFRKPSTRSSS